LEAIAVLLDDISEARLRPLRAIEVAEMLDMAEVGALLKVLAVGASGARRTDCTMAGRRRGSSPRRAQEVSTAKQVRRSKTLGLPHARGKLSSSPSPPFCTWKIVTGRGAT
jgi:hypothetical protein